MKIGELIKNKIKERGLVQAEIARRVDKSPQRFNQDLKHDHRINTEYLKSISTAMDYDFFQHLSKEMKAKSGKNYEVGDMPHMTVNESENQYAIKDDYIKCLKALNDANEKNKQLMQQIIDIQQDRPGKHASTA